MLRNIKKVPGFLEYLDQNDNEDFVLLVLTYRSILEEAGIVTPGIRTNMDLIMHHYDLFQKEYADTQPPQDNTLYDINKVLTWNPRPQWAVPMSVEEIDYLDHFIWQVDGLPSP